MAKKQKLNNEKAVQEFVKENGYPEVGHFGEGEEGKKALQKFYKHLTIEQLLEWVGIEGLEVKETDSEPIYRMRLAMAVLYLHYPKPAPKKKQSKYSKYSLEDLVQMAVDHEVPVEPTDDERIMRMRVIMALRAAGKIE